MLFEFGDGLIEVFIERQFCLETYSPLLTIRFSSYEQLDALNLDEVGDMHLDPSNDLFPYTCHAYPEQLEGLISKGQLSELTANVAEDVTPEPKAYRWIRWFDHFDAESFPKRFGKYMVGHALPWELNKIKLEYCKPSDKFFAYPLARIPQDLDDIWVCEDEESDFV
jgi:hypothetical protein